MAGWNVIDFVVVTSQVQGFASRVLPRLTKLDNAKLRGVVLIEGMNPSFKGRRRRRKLAKLARVGLLGAVNGIRMRSWYDVPSEPLAEVCQELDVPFHKVPFASSPETEVALRDIAPNLAVSLGNAYLPRRVHGFPEYGTINLHTERLPRYQNAQGVIWPIYNGEATTGYTIHMVSDEIDAGNILLAEDIPILFAETLQDTVKASVAEVFSRAEFGLATLLDDFDKYYANRRPQGRGGRYTTPTFWQFLRIRRNHQVLRGKARAAAGETAL